MEQLTVQLLTAHMQFSVVHFGFIVYLQFSDHLLKLTDSLRMEPGS